MNKNFISKFETKNGYKLGSFDAYYDESKDLIMNNNDINHLEAENMLKKGMPTAFRAAIENKNGEYIGFIGLYDVDAKNKTASVRFETNCDLSNEDIREIYGMFEDYMCNSLNIKSIPKFLFNSENVAFNYNRKKVETSCNIKVTNQFLKEGVSDEVLAKFRRYYNNPKLNLQMPFTIVINDRVVGIIGLSNLSWANQRANLCIYLDKSLGDEVARELSSSIIDDYLEYVHNSNVHSVTFSVSGRNKPMLDVIEKSKMDYYSRVPFGSYVEGNLVDSLMFEHFPGMAKNDSIIIPENILVPASEFDGEKSELSDRINLDGGFKMIRPSAFEKENVDFNEVLKGYVEAMQNREEFTIPLGEDKYFLQVGNDNYGLTKALKGYSYVILDDNNNFIGFVNKLRENANGRNVEVEIGITPAYQGHGLGKKALNKFYDELFSTGVASVTSNVFGFNNKSLSLHEKVASLYGVRIESYYVNGKLYNMNNYSKVNKAPFERMREYYKKL